VNINSEALPRQLRGQPKPLYWVSGDETLLVQESADKIRQFCHRQGFSEREIWHIDAAGNANWQAILLSANSLSLFAERKLLELRCASGKPGEGALKALSGYSSNPNPDCVLLACSPKLETTTTRSKTFKALVEDMLWVQAWPVERSALPAWIGRRLESQGLHATPEALALLAERVEGNLLAAQQEVEKLALLITPGATIDAEVVVRAVADSSRFDVFDLVDFLLKADAAGAVRVINGLKGEGTEAPVILWAISRELRRLISVRQAMDRGKSPDGAMEAQGVWKNQRALFRQAATRLSLAQLRQALQAARAVDASIKGAGSGSPWDLLRSLALALCGRPVLETPSSRPAPAGGAMRG
jgi:DNA polymerase-3 subunit delta